MAKHLASLGLAALLLSGSGCVKDVGVIQVEGLCALPEDCSFDSGGCDAFYMEPPIIDVALTTTLRVVLNVTNQLAEGGNDLGGVDTNTAYVDSVSASYSFLDPGFALAGSSSMSIGSIQPGETSAVAMYVIEGVAGTALRALPIPAWVSEVNYVDMVAHVTIKGQFVDGTEFETEPYDLGVRVCRGCLPACTGSAGLGAVCPPGATGQTPIVCEAVVPPPASCVTDGTFCGSNPNVANGDPDTLYACTAGQPPGGATVCPNGCNATVTPNVCNP